MIDEITSLYKLKRCIDCGVEKVYTEFPKNKNKRDGLFPYCKPCNKRRAYLNENKRAREKTCVHPGCNGGVYKSNYCKKHYGRILIHGDPYHTEYMSAEETQQKINGVHGENAPQMTNLNYTGKRQLCNWYCPKCGHCWSTTPDNVQRGSGCPICCREFMGGDGDGFYSVSYLRSNKKDDIYEKAFFYFFGLNDYLLFGVTKKDVSLRVRQELKLKTYKTSREIAIINTTLENAILFEQIIKIAFKNDAGLAKGLQDEGFTETLPKSYERLISNMIKDFQEGRKTLYDLANEFEVDKVKDYLEGKIHD